MSSESPEEMEGRNFRSYYYEKVGFRVVEEKKSLEILLKEKPVDKMKLTHFALRFPVPNILPAYIDQHKFVSEQRKQQFEDLMHYLRIIQPNSHQIPKPHLYAFMRVLEKGNLKLNYQHQLKSRDNQVYMKVCEALVDIMESESDVYWIAKNFFEILKSLRPYLPALVSYSDKVMMREDEELYNDLVRQNVWQELPLQEWYERGFATFIPILALQKVWDKILGGSSMVMVFVMVAMLLKLRQSSLEMTTIQTLVGCAKKLTESSFEMVVTDGISLWQQYGSPLHPGSNTDCLKDHSKAGYRTSNKNSNHHPHSTTMSR